MPQQPDFSRYETAVAAVRAQLVAYAALVWASTQFTDTAMARLVELIVPKVLSGQLVVANLTSAYLAKATGTTALPVAPLVTEGRGIAADLVYQRPVIATRSEVAAGNTVDFAKRAGGRRLESLVTTDLQMAKVRQADVSLAHAGRTHYRRVPKGAGTCAMCLIASTKRYNTGNLAPIHPGCDCSVSVIPKGMDLDEVIDENLLLETHAKVEELTSIRDAGGRAVDYRKLIITQEHGEIGPVLSWRGDHFDGPLDVNLGPAPKKPSVFEMAPKNLDEVPHNRNPAKGRTVPDFVGGDRTKRTAVQKVAANKNLADILAEIQDV